MTGEEEDVSWQRDRHERKMVNMMRDILNRVVRVWVPVDGDGEDGELGDLVLACTECMVGMRRKRRQFATRCRREENFARLIRNGDFAVSWGDLEDARESAAITGQIWSKRGLGSNDSKEVCLAIAHWLKVLRSWGGQHGRIVCCWIGQQMPGCSFTPSPFFQTRGRLASKQHVESAAAQQQNCPSYS